MRSLITKDIQRLIDSVVVINSACTHINISFRYYFCFFSIQYVLITVV